MGLHSTQYKLLCATWVHWEAICGIKAAGLKMSSKAPCLNIDYPLISATRKEDKSKTCQEKKKPVSLTITRMQIISNRGCYYLSKDIKRPARETYLWRWETEHSVGSFGWLLHFPGWLLPDVVSAWFDSLSPSIAICPFTWKSHLKG